MPKNDSSTKEKNLKTSTPSCAVLNQSKEL